jgi:uncharacterized protein YecT (DUF1311 family)
MKIALTAAALAILLPGAVNADPGPETAPPYSADYQRCSNSGDAAKGVTSAMLDCMKAEYDRQDGRLNRVYTQRMASLSATRRQTLRASQRRWLAARDPGCRRQAKPSEGGTIWGLDMMGCQINATIRRTAWLERYR